jgi:hypothetical protein
MNAQQQGQTLMAYEDVAALMYEEGYWLWKLAKPTQRGSAWTLSRALPNGKRRTVWLAPALGAALGARWPHDRKRNLHGMLDGVDIMRRLAAAPPQDQYPLMAVRTLGGTDYTIVDVNKGFHGRGWRRVIATADGELYSAGDCDCRDRVHVAAVDLVTEDKFTLCAACRRRIA